MKLGLIEILSKFCRVCGTGTSSVPVPSELELVPELGTFSSVPKHHCWKEYTKIVPDERYVSSIQPTATTAATPTTVYDLNLSKKEIQKTLH